MKGTFILKSFMGILFLGSTSFCAKASEVKPGSHITIEIIIRLNANTDTIPSLVKPAQVEPAKPVIENPVAGIIKVVPKARRVTVPRQVVKVVPVKLVKPKIIKPVIKLLN